MVLLESRIDLIDEAVAMYDKSEWIRDSEDAEDDASGFKEDFLLSAWSILRMLNSAPLVLAKKELKSSIL